MRTLTALSLALLLVGCRTGSVVLGPIDDGNVSDGGGVSDSGNVTSSDDTGGAGDSDDGGDTNNDGGDSSFPYTGEYAGSLMLFFEDGWSAFELADCTLTTSVADSGVMDGEASCRFQGGGGGGGGRETIPLAGEVSADGEIAGALELGMGPGGGQQMGFTGEISTSGKMTLLIYEEIPEIGGAFTGEAALDRR